jgi:polysaccharide deacetylase family protein (PEP-CTERM system associated)
MPAPLNGLSFDVEDWFQVENLKGVISRKDWDSCELRVVQNTRKILQILKNHNTRATFFVLGWIAEKCPFLVKEIAAEKHEIASHGYAHELVYNLTPVEFESDLRRSRQVLESITHTPVMGYRAPSFSITPRSEWAVDVLKKVGLAYDSSIFPTSFHNRYGFNGTSVLPFRFSNQLVELPLATYNLFGSRFPLGGGGYFRLFPYAFFRGLFRRLNSQGKGVIFYLHPWELDPDQPRMNICFNYRFRHYINLHKTERRLNRLLADFKFGPLKNLISNANTLMSQ